MNKNLVIKVLIIAVPTYTMAIITNAMVYTIPMLAISTLIATNIFKDDEDIEKELNKIVLIRMSVLILAMILMVTDKHYFNEQVCVI